MSFDWKLYLLLSDELINDQKNPTLQEAYLRSAISRSYYGVFCIARNFLAKTNTLPPYNIHNYVIVKYKKSNNKKERKIGVDLDKLRGKRISADYIDGFYVNTNEATFANQLAIQILENLKKIGAA